METASTEPLPRVADLDAVFFDFDGVLLESAAIKDDAFRRLFSSMPEHLDRILAHHREHLGRSRFEKFDWVYSELLGRRLDRDESQELGRRFSRIVFEQMTVCPLVPGARDLLEALRGVVECFVVSATPQGELEALIAHHELAGFFVEVRGYPPAKTAIFADLLARHGLSGEAVLAIGDGISDYEAARAVGARFIARDSESSRQDWSATRVATVPSLADLIGPLGLGSASRPGTVR